MISTITRTVTALAAAAVITAAIPVAAFADPEPKSLPAKPVKEARYCVEQVTTGSILRKDKECHTRAEWIAKTGIDPARVK